MATSILDVMGKVQEVLAGTSQAKTALTEATKAQSASLDRSQKIYETVATNAALIEQQKGIAALKVQQQNQASLLAAGEDPEGSYSALNKDLARLRAAQDQTAKTADEITALRSVPIEDGIMNFIGSKFKAGLKMNALEAQSSQMQQLQQSVVGMNNALQETFQTNTAKAKVVTDATIQAATENAAAAGLLEAEKARREGLQVNAQGLIAVNQLSLEQLRVMTTATAEQRAGEDQARQNRAEQRAVEAFNFDKEMQGLRLKTAKLGLAEDEAAKKMEVGFLAKINAGRAARGFPTLSQEEAFSAGKAFRSGQVAAEMQSDYQIGNLVAANGGKQVLAQTPAKAIEVVTKFGAIIPKSQERTAELLAQVKSMIPANVDQKNPEAVASWINKETATQAKNLQSSITPGARNPFDIGDLNPYLQHRAVASLPVTQALKSMSAAGIPLDKPAEILNALRAKIKAGDLTSSQAAGIADVYRAANLQHQESANFFGYGIKADPSKYNVRIPGSRIPLNLQNEQEIQRYLMKPPVSSINMFGGGGGDLPPTMR